MDNSYYNRAGSRKKKSPLRLVFILLLMAAVGLLGAFSFTQFLAIQSLRSEQGELVERLEKMEQENEALTRINEELVHENELLVEENMELTEENQMMRSETIIMNGSRETNLVAITIDDGASAPLINQTLDYLKEHDVTATLFPMGWWVEQEPEAWRRAVAEGHELGNHTYSHAFLTTLSEEGVRRELSGWQEAVNEALGFEYKTLYFRPPGMYGFTAPGSSQSLYYQGIIGDKGMFTVLWDIELVYALRNEPTTPERITEHVLNNARGGSIVLLHFTPADIAALPAIIRGLRSRGLEPCSLGELLLANPEG